MRRGEVIDDPEVDIAQNARRKLLMYRAIIRITFSIYRYQEKNILKLAEIFGRASDSLLGELMSDVLNQNPYWRSKKGDDKWAQLSIVSMAAVSIICHSTDVNPEEKLEDEEIYDTLIEYLENHEPLDKQQSRKQWEYFAKTITEVCSIFGIDKENYEDKYDLFNGYSSLDYFADVIENINN